MEKSERKKLKPGDSILLSRYRDKNAPQEEYRIESFIGEGSSTVCYKATRIIKDGEVTRKKTGILKEFYPLFSKDGERLLCDSLERRPSDNQLIPTEEIVREFNEMRKNYLGSYGLLSKTMTENPDDSEILERYIPSSDILYGYLPQEIEKENEFVIPLWNHLDDDLDGDGNLIKPTVYIWSPGRSGIVFESYISEIKNDLKNNSDPEKTLLDILNVIKTLTDSIIALHKVGLLHMDINPSNFLVYYDSGPMIDPSNILMYDINTICDIDNIQMSGTDGYSAPEIAKRKASNTSDIYSIGATLFKAIVITDEIPDGIYRDFYYDKIEDYLEKSILLKKIKTNFDESLKDLKNQLCNILKGCLAAKPSNRYQACTILKTELEKAEEILREIWRKKRDDWPDPTVVIQKLLYEHPLYEAIDDEAKDINVLVIGLDAYGQKFIDVCLQSGQMSGVNMNILDVSDNPQGSAVYLQGKPALSEFIKINGSIEGEAKDAYAALDFENKSFNYMKPQNNNEIIQSLIEQSEKNQKEYDYVFISLGEKVNAPIAEFISERIKHRCPVCYVFQKTEDDSGMEKSQNKLYPVYVNVPVKVKSLDQMDEMDEMAFNTHISWMDTLNINVMAERDKFFKSKEENDKYNRISSLAFALSVKYKLHSVQIECSNLLEAAKAFSEQILDVRSTDKEAKKKFDRLVDLEHRRWMIEHAVNGWKAPKNDKGKLDLEACVERGSVKDNDKKTHPCMVRGSESSPLSDLKYQENNHLLWNTGKIDDKLDDLDRMSIELHRCFRRKAETLKKEDLGRNRNLLDIQENIPLGCDEVERAFKQFRFALKNIINEVESYSRQYGHYQKAFKKKLSEAELPVGIKEKIENSLKRIERDFFPIVESNLYRNYKAYDERLIENIPFILTYRYMPTIAIAFEDGKYQNGRNEAVFANVAAATVLSPKNIKFLYCFDKSSKVDLLIKKLKAVLNYFNKRNVNSQIEMVIACLNDVSDKEKADLKEELEELSKSHKKGDGNAQFEKYTIYKAADNAEAREALIYDLIGSDPSVDLYDGSNALFSSPSDNAKFLNGIQGLIPYFEFDWRNKKFNERIDCEYLKYVKDASFIRIEDMFALMNASDNKFNLPEFADDYETLWKIYTGEYVKDANKKFEYGVGNWNYLCRCLEKYESEQKPLAKIEINTLDSPSYTTLTYFLPEFCFSTVKTLIRSLKDYGIAEKESTIEIYTSDTCKLELKINKKYEDELKKVFDDPKILLPYYGIEVCKKDKYVEIKWNNLTVTDANLEIEDKEKHEFALKVLRLLEKEHFISQLKEDEKKVSFIYSSPRMKKLLTCAGEILEIYAYYDVLKTGYFDDVVTGYEFIWEDEKSTNEIDLVLTKGFKSIFVECKAVKKLDQDYYHKLKSITGMFSIGGTPVLLGNTYSHINSSLNAQNNQQRDRGKLMSIKTISNEKDIINIGETLKKLMEESK